VAVFDTAFHQTLPEHSFLYALPYQLYRRHRIRRYGFHGTSHRYVAYRYRTLRGIARDATNIITLHLGNGCSIAAIKGGNSIDTSMGFTPLEGLVMGTRSGDLDASIVDLVASKEGLSAREVETLLNKQSGLLGISGLTDDMRELLAEAREHDDRRARLAIEIFCYRARKYIGSYLAAMNGAEAIVFTGGIGENSAEIRAKICSELIWMGIELDAELNAKHGADQNGRISTENSRVAVYVIPTTKNYLSPATLCVSLQVRLSGFRYFPRWEAALRTRNSVYDVLTRDREVVLTRSKYEFINCRISSATSSGSRSCVKHSTSPVRSSTIDTRRQSSGRKPPDSTNAREKYGSRSGVSCDSYRRKCPTSSNGEPDKANSQSSTAATCQRPLMQSTRMFRLPKSQWTRWQSLSKARNRSAHDQMSSCTSC
jgi:hypothetical protein